MLVPVMYFVHHLKLCNIIGHEYKSNATIYGYYFHVVVRFIKICNSIEHTIKMGKTYTHPHTSIQEKRASNIKLVCIITFSSLFYPNFFLFHSLLGSQTIKTLVYGRMLTKKKRFCLFGTN